VAQRASRGELEAQVMDVLWDAEESLTPREVQTAINTRRRGLAYTTVMTILVRLWQKELLDREPRGRAFAYRPVATRDELAALRMQEILDKSGDRLLALNHFVDGMSRREASQLARVLDERKQRR
jgi:predicted transcriptional regulator